MSPDDPVCLCFHVTRRKVVNFIRVEKPQRASQLSQCGGAGTGCGWCRDYLTRMLAAAKAGEDIGAALPEDSAGYAAGRAEHIRQTGHQPGQPESRQEPPKT